MDNKAIRIKCYQNMVNYKKPASIQFQESFKLPPYSTVIGMIHKVCNFTDYKPMRVSIQGNSKSSVADMYTKYFFGQKYEKGTTRHQFCTEDKNGFQYGIVQGQGYAELIIDVSLIIHIKPEDESLFDIIVNGLKNPSVYPSLGRYEDILRIDSVDIVEIEKAEEVALEYDAYIPLDLIETIDNKKSITGTVYSLNKVYKIDEKTNFRNWNAEGGKVKVKYVKSGSKLYFDDGIEKEKKLNVGIFFA